MAPAAAPLSRKTLGARMQNFFFIKLLVILIIFMGCTAKKGYLPPTPTENSLPEKQKVVRAQQTEEQYALNKSGRVVLFDANFSIETDNPDSVHSQLVEMSRKYDGYILESRNNMTAIRIPSKIYIKLLTRLINWER